MYEILLYYETRSLGALWGPTSTWRPFGPALGPSGLLDFVLHPLWPLRPCDPKNHREIQNYPIFSGRFETSGSMIHLLVPKISPWAVFVKERTRKSIGFSCSVGYTVGTVVVCIFLPQDVKTVL